ncbi:hypothetical protein HUJ04_010779 [Dendroctonus ponderosae]|nr:hypothetical protein HUJ04_010779 [Dendroctonus ponderosae]
MTGNSFMGEVKTHVQNKQEKGNQKRVIIRKQDHMTVEFIPYGKAIIRSKNSVSYDCLRGIVVGFPEFPFLPLSFSCRKFYLCLSGFRRCLVWLLGVPYASSSVPDVMLWSIRARTCSYCSGVRAEVLLCIPFSAVLSFFFFMTGDLIGSSNIGLALKFYAGNTLLSFWETFTVATFRNPKSERVCCARAGIEPDPFQCAKKSTLDFSAMTKCAISSEGDKLLASYGDKTWNLEPNLSYVPTVVFNNSVEINFSDMNKSLVDFKSVMCSKIEQNHPDVCKSSDIDILIFYCEATLVRLIIRVMQMIRKIAVKLFIFIDYQLWILIKFSLPGPPR